MSKSQLNSPFQNPAGATPPNRTKPGDTVDKNICPYFDKPRDPDHDGDPEVFFTGVNGKTYHGKVEGASVETPMNGPRRAATGKKESELGKE